MSANPRSFGLENEHPRARALRLAQPAAIASYLGSSCPLHSPYTLGNPAYLPFLDSIGGDYAGFVRRKGGGQTR